MAATTATVPSPVFLKTTIVGSVVSVFLITFLVGVKSYMEVSINDL